MSQPIFVNKDAEWLYALGNDYLQGAHITDEEMEIGMRLTSIAKNIQSLDDKLLALSGTDDERFAAGVREAYSRIYERSNLPESERTMPRPAMKVLGLDKPVRRIPTGVSASKLKSEVERKAKLSPETAQRLTGLKLNISALKLREDS